MNRSFIFIVVAFLAISARYAADAKKINRSRKRGKSPSPAPGAKLGDNGPFLDFMKSETKRIIGTLPWSTVAEIRVFQAMPSLVALSLTLPPMLAANLEVMEVAYPVALALIKGNNSDSLKDIKAAYRDVFLLHLAHGQGMAYMALSYSDADVNDVMWKYYYMYQNMWSVDKIGVYSKWDFAAYAGVVKPEWDLLKQWAVKYDPSVSKSVIFGKENPMADLLSMTAMDPFGRANVVFDWEKHYWEFKAGLISGAEAHKKLTLYNYWHWESLFQLTIPASFWTPYNVENSLVSSFKPFVK